MTLSDISIKNPVFAWMLMAALILFGWVGFRGMGISQLPDVDFPVVTVSVTWEGASPEVVETEVTDTIEDAVMQVQGVKEVTSTSRQGSASISIEFELNRDIDTALQEVQTNIAQAQKTLPKDIDPPIIKKTNPEDNPIMWLAISGDRDLPFMMRYTKDYLKDKFTTVPGVGEVQLGGYVEPNLRVWMDADKMQARELTVGDVTDAISAQHSEVPAGFIDTGREEMNVRVMGEASTVKEFQNIIIPSRNGAPLWSRVRIGDVAHVEDSLDDIRRISRVGGQPAIGLGIKKQRGSNAVAVAEAVKKRMAEVQATLPEGLKIGVNFDSTKFIEQSTRDLMHELIMAGLLTAFVCFLFLGSWSSAINIILAIPTSIMGAFMVLYFFGFTLNTFTLLGLTLVIGIIVDDAIMVLENIVRHQEMGEPRVKAAIVGAREITPAAVAASIAILAIFVPVVFMKGIIGKFFFQFGITISAAVMLSLLEALTLAPMRCAQFLNIHNESWLARNVNKLMGAVTRSYQRGLAFSLKHWILVLLSSIVFFAASLSLTKFLKKEFVPAQDQGSLFIRLQTPPGSSIEFTDKVFREAEKKISARPEVLRYYAAIGGFGGGEVNTGIVFVTLKDKKVRPADPATHRVLSQQELMPILRKEMASIPGVFRPVIQDLSLSGFTSKRGFPIEFVLVGSDWDKMGDLSEQLMKKMSDSGYMSDVDSNYLLGQPEVRVLPNRDKAAARGVSVVEIGNTINAMIGGVRVGKYTKGGRRYDIRVRLAEGDRRAVSDINKIWVRNNHGEVIRLSDVVDIVQKKTLVSVSRVNRERAITMYANVAAGKSQNDAIDVLKRIAKETLPDGYHIELTGSSKTSEESSSALIITFVLGIIVAYMVLASQYNSFIHPIVVLMALPFSVTGAFIALLLGGKSINLYSMIGLILLMGIVKKNAILLVDFTNERRKAGLGVKEALLEACPIRLRPIIMTSIATISAAVPTALGLGEGSETRVPMALVIIGGVAVSTLLTLFVVPAFYLFMSRFESYKHDANLKDALRELGEIPGPS
jgi:HAE1 family hydrophobic/amphiphilic exporter-1